MMLENVPRSIASRVRGWSRALSTRHRSFYMYVNRSAFGVFAALQMPPRAR